MKKLKIKFIALNETTGNISGSDLDTGLPCNVKLSLVEFERFKQDNQLTAMQWYHDNGIKAYNIGGDNPDNVIVTFNDIKLIAIHGAERDYEASSWVID